MNELIQCQRGQAGQYSDVKGALNEWVRENITNEDRGGLALRRVCSQMGRSFPYGTFAVNGVGVYRIGHAWRGK